MLKFMAAVLVVRVDLHLFLFHPRVDREVMVAPSCPVLRQAHLLL
jgi:hypothetical protein